MLSILLCYVSIQINFADFKVSSIFNSFKADDNVQGLVFSPSGNSAYYLTDSGLFTLELSSKHFKSCLIEKKILSICESKNKNYIYSLDSDGVIWQIYFDSQKKSTLFRLEKQYRKGFTDLIANSDNSILAIVATNYRSEASIDFIGLNNGKKICSIKVPDILPFDALFFEKNKIAICGAKVNGAIIVEISNNEPKIISRNYGDGSLSKINYNLKDGKLYLASLGKNFIYVCDPKNKENIKKIILPGVPSCISLLHEHDIIAVALDPDRNSEESSVCFYSTKDYKMLLKKSSHKNFTRGIFYFPNKDLIITSGNSGEFIEWKIDKNE